MPLAVHVMDPLMGERHAFIARLDWPQARQSTACDFPIVERRSPWAAGTWPLVEVPQVGIAAERTHQGHIQGADAIDELLFAEIAIDHQGLERLELLRCDDTCDMGQIGINARLCRVPALRGGSLGHTKGIGAVMGAIDPRQRGNLQALVRPAVGTVPAYIETRGLLPLLGTKRGSKASTCSWLGATTSTMAAWLKLTKSKSRTNHRAKVCSWYGL